MWRMRQRCKPYSLAADLPTVAQQHPMAEHPKWHQPSKYQLAFDYGYRPIESAAVDGMRFTYEVNEEVKVLSPGDAGC